MNLFAYHLPLDAHPRLGNNAQLGLRLGSQAEPASASRTSASSARSPSATALDAFARRVEQALARAPLVVAGDGRPLRRIAWCTGGAQGYFEAAIAAGADAYLTGEISEPQAHYARETGVAFLACGHHATERYGVQALAAHVAAQFGLEHALHRHRQPGLRPMSAPSLPLALTMGDACGIGPEIIVGLRRGAARGCVRASATWR